MRFSHFFGSALTVLCFCCKKRQNTLCPAKDHRGERTRVLYLYFTFFSTALTVICRTYIFFETQSIYNIYLYLQSMEINPPGIFFILSLLSIPFRVKMIQSSHHKVENWSAPHNKSYISSANFLHIITRSR